MIKIIIVDDDLYIRESLKVILSIQADIEVVTTCENGKECIEALGKYNVDLILMDLRMPIMSGIECLNYLTKQQKEYAHVKVLILTTFDEDDLIEQAITLGAAGYILKNSTPDKIASAIRAVAMGNQVFEPQIINALAKGEENKLSNTNGEEIEGNKNTEEVQKIRAQHLLEAYDLTNREIEIVQLIAIGLSNKEISTQIYISEGTVKNYISNILSKMSLKHRTQIAILYLQI